MKPKLTACMTLALVGMLAAACASTGVLSGTGPALITAVDEGGAATDQSATSSVGKACSANILGLFAVGDSSVDTAKMDGDITTVSSVDHEYLNVLFLFGRVCTIVRGE